MIQALETKLQFSFPEAYKAHLLLFNGGRCAPSSFTFKEDGKTTESAVHFFLAINGHPYNDLLDYFETFKIDEKRMPNTIFPIAYDHNGNQICLDSLDGNIYFWDHEREVDYTIADDSDRSNLYFIASSLKEFLISLTPCELDYHPPS
ncbi:MAG: SMI1/KNR4 family protein [Bacteroidota bacterium]